MVKTQSHLLTRQDGAWADAWVVDIGLGDDAGTTADLAVCCGPVLGVDIVADRVLRAREAYPELTVAVGDLDAAPPSGRARLVRAMNVLRELTPEEVPGAHGRLATHLVDGGLVLEGSTSRTGDVLVAHVLRREGDHLQRAGLVFGTTFARGFSPRMFFHALPRDLRKRVRGTAIDPLLLAWEDAASGDPRARFDALAQVPGLERVGEGVAQWFPSGGVPHGRS